VSATPEQLREQLAQLEAYAETLNPCASPEAADEWRDVLGMAQGIGWALHYGSDGGHCLMFNEVLAARGGKL
jgi:hypothetical protein